MLRSHEIELRVRYSETDAMGFLHHANFFSYFEVGRTELFRAQGGDYRAMEESGLFFVVVKVDCRYYKPARYDDVVRLRTTITRITPARIEHEYRLFRGEDLLAVGHSTLACVNRRGEIQPIPALLLDA
ncbi:MAG: acyl-CoA thioesterase [Planctomycetota bacterium]|nr:MAG: acyl-CoA thioesterase [Planctomycetota bacterium]